MKLKHFEIRKYPEIGLSDSSKSHRWRCHITEYECDLAIAQNSNRLVSVWILLEVLITCFFLGWLTFLARKSWGSSKFKAFNTLVPIYRLSIWRKSLVKESIRHYPYVLLHCMMMWFQTLWFKILVQKIEAGPKSKFIVWKRLMVYFRKDFLLKMVYWTKNQTLAYRLILCTSVLDLYRGVPH